MSETGGGKGENAKGKCGGGRALGVGGVERLKEPPVAHRCSRT